MNKTIMTAGGCAAYRTSCRGQTKGCRLSGKDHLNVIEFIVPLNPL